MRAVRRSPRSIELGDGGAADAGDVAELVAVAVDAHGAVVVGVVRLADQVEGLADA
jgi:hypothetical protein